MYVSVLIYVYVFSFFYSGTLLQAVIAFAAYIFEEYSSLFLFFSLSLSFSLLNTLPF